MALLPAGAAVMSLAVHGLPVPGVPEYGRYSKVDITRYISGGCETVTVTRADDEKSKEKGEPFMKFRLAPDILNMIKSTDTGKSAIESPRYAYTFYMNDGSVRTFYTDGLLVAKDDVAKGYKHHPASDYSAFKNVTDNMYFAPRVRDNR